MIIVYTDGSCRGNGKASNTGGYGVVALQSRDGNEDEAEIIECYSKSSLDTTNNREELKAILYTMIKYGAKDNNIPQVYSDSAYAVNTLTNWMFGWQKNGWIKSDKKTPENLDLIQAYYNLYKKGHRIDLKKVKGHSGQKWNEIADKLATGELKSIKEVKEKL